MSTETQRIEAFSDGVFAIAITLLILEIHVPTIEPDSTLLKAVIHEWASFLAFLIGFLTLLVCWINHHFMFTKIKNSNSTLLLLNGFKLLVVTITPFATALLAKNIKSVWRDSSVIVYAFNFTLMGLAMTLIWFYAKRKGFIHARSKDEMKVMSRLYAFATIISATIWLVSFLNIFASFILFCLMFLIYGFPERMVAIQIQRLKNNSAPAVQMLFEENTKNVGEEV